VALQATAPPGGSAAVPESSSDDVLPPAYLNAVVMPLQLALMTHPAFPLSPVGAVHSRNTITQVRSVSDIVAVLSCARRRRALPYLDSAAWARLASLTQNDGKRACGKYTIQYNL
jgi:hypothetical protein